MGRRLAEMEGKRSHDPQYSPRSAARATATGFPVGAHGEVFAGPLIIGAGPAGLSVAACLTMGGVPYALLERHGCIASLWRHRTYRRLCLHLPKRYCELPLMPFPASYPEYPTREQFLDYLEEYLRTFGIRPFFRQEVVSAEFDGELWCVRTKEVVAAAIDGGQQEAVLSTATREYRSKWLVVATGENAEPVLPEIDGLDGFKGQVMHSCDYRSGEPYQGSKVLVVGCGNSGMEVSLDLSNHNVHTSMVVRDTVHVLPREIMGLSTFRLSLWLLMCLSVQTVDRLLLLLAWFVLGDTARLGIPRPSIGPMELKKVCGKTPVLDVGTIAKIKSGDIKVLPGIHSFHEHSVEFTDGKTEDFDVVILATGYKSNVPYWLKENDFFSEKDGFPRKPNEWKGKNGLYAAGFSRRGLLGVSIDATKIADDIAQYWNDIGYEKHKTK
ncbi:indole-3-pyruvate monooxygenase YUCCA2-like [Panicum miliaceum]|uniref:Flavin-containing monooxygenase n=1 Tax=Panicum miliaceum TaxID=4540 RepID=A0A3L6SJB0_PANMI|nr:indole-3-pyruvate monooxygenase YUCCA2-like [Panicum miliaceum]